MHKSLIFNIPHIMFKILNYPMPCFINRPGVAGAVLQTHVSHETCHMSHVIYHLSHVTCHVSNVTCIFFLQQIGEAS